MSKSKVSCEKCGVLFTQADEVVSSKVLCSNCAAERKAQLRSAKQPAAAAEAPSRASSGDAPARSRRGASGDEAAAPKPRREHLDVRKLKEEESAKLMKMAWMITGGIGLVVAIFLLFVKSRHTDIDAAKAARAEYLDGFLKYVQTVDRTSEPAIDAALARIEKEKKADPNIKGDKSGWLASPIDPAVRELLRALQSSKMMIVETRGLVTKLDAIDAQVNGSPTLDVLGKQFAAIRDAELKKQSEDAGGQHKTRFDEINKKVTSSYIDTLRSSADAAASATTGEALAPYGLLEDALYLVRMDAQAINDVDTLGKINPMLSKEIGEIDGIVLRLFDEAYQNKQPWQDLLTDKNLWMPAGHSSSFSAQFGQSLVIKNPAGESSTSGGLSFTPGEMWRDYVLDLEFTLESGTLVFYTRVGDVMDTKQCPAFSVGPQKNVNVDFGKQYNMKVTVIGNQILVGGENITPWQDDIGKTKSRRGEPGFVAQAGTSATISRFKVRRLR